MDRTERWRCAEFNYRPSEVPPKPDGMGQQLAREVQTGNLLLP